MSCFDFSHLEIQTGWHLVNDCAYFQIDWSSRKIQLMGGHACVNILLQMAQISKGKLFAIIGFASATCGKAAPRPTALHHQSTSRECPSATPPHDASARHLT
jgi:hypothetical protein